MDRKGKTLSALGLVCFALCMAAVICAGVVRMRAQVREVSAQMAQNGPEEAMESFRTLRQQLRAMEKAQLNDLAHDAEADAELREAARRHLLDLCAREEMEMTIEGVLSMRGFASPVVTVGEDSVNVLIVAEVVTQQQSAVILELACRETGVQSGNVKIIPVN